MNSHETNTNEKLSLYALAKQMNVDFHQILEKFSNAAPIGDAAMLKEKNPLHCYVDAKLAERLVHSMKLSTPSPTIEPYFKTETGEADTEESEGEPLPPLADISGRLDYGLGVFAEL